MVYVRLAVVAQGPVRDAAGQLRPVEGLDCRFAAATDGRHDPQVVADAQKMAEGLTAAAHRGLSLIAAHQPSGSGGYTLHEAALSSDFERLAPALQRLADMAGKATDLEQAEGPDRELTVLAWANHAVKFARYIRDESQRPTEMMVSLDVYTAGIASALNADVFADLDLPKLP